MSQSFKTRMEIWVARLWIAVDAICFAVKKRIYRIHYGPETEWPKDLVRHVYLPDGASPAALNQLRLILTIKQLAAFGSFNYEESQACFCLGAYMDLRDDMSTDVSRVAKLIHLGAPRYEVLVWLVEIGDWKPDLIRLVRTADDMARLHEWLTTEDSTFELNAPSPEPA